MSHRQPPLRWSVALAAIALLGACTGTDAATGTDDTTSQSPSPSPTTDSSGPSATPSSDGPTDLTQLPEDTPLEPGTYSMGLLFDDGPTRAVVDVPEGFTGGGPVLTSDDGDVAFWGNVTQVDTDPCLGGRHVPAGTSVRDLATVLAAQRHMRTSRPVPVTVGGFHGVYVRSVAPAHLRRCRRGSVTIFTAEDTWLQSDVPSTNFNAWILDVRGTRVVGGARIFPGGADSARLLRMVESAEFTLADRP